MDMENASEQPQLYRVWGEDKVAQGPLDWATLIEWIKAHRVSPDSWVLLEDRNQWQRAAEVPELKAAFASRAPAALAPTRAVNRAKLTPRESNLATLRRIKLFEGLQPQQLESFAQYLEVVRCPQFGHIIRQGQRGQAMYLVCEGEVRALTIVEGKESILTTITAGDWFGEVSLLDHGPRSVDVVADQDSVLLKLSNESFERLLREAPTVAVPFLLALSRTVVERMRRATKRYEDSIRFIRTSGLVH